jgi:hypothetical protein
VLIANIYISEVKESQRRYIEEGSERYLTVVLDIYCGHWVGRGYIFFGIFENVSE